MYKTTAMNMEKTMIHETGQIEFFTDHDKNLTLVKFKSGIVCWIRNEDIELFKKDLYTVIQRYRVTEEKMAAPKAM